MHVCVCVCVLYDISFNHTMVVQIRYGELSLEHDDVNTVHAPCARPSVIGANNNNNNNVCTRFRANTTLFHGFGTVVGRVRRRISLLSQSVVISYSHEISNKK